MNNVSKKAYRIIVEINGEKQSTKKVVSTVEEAEELVAVWNDLDSELGVKYSYEEEGK